MNYFRKDIDIIALNVSRENKIDYYFEAISNITDDKEVDVFNINFLISLYSYTNAREIREKIIHKLKMNLVSRLKNKDDAIEAINYFNEEEHNYQLTPDKLDYYSFINDQINYMLVSDLRTKHIIKDENSKVNKIYSKDIVLKFLVSSYLSFYENVMGLTQDEVDEFAADFIAEIYTQPSGQLMIEELSREYYKICVLKYISIFTDKEQEILKAYYGDGVSQLSITQLARHFNEKPEYIKSLITECDSFVEWNLMPKNIDNYKQVIFAKLKLETLINDQETLSKLHSKNIYYVSDVLTLCEDEVIEIINKSSQFEKIKNEIINNKLHFRSIKNFNYIVVDKKMAVPEALITMLSTFGFPVNKIYLSLKRKDYSVCSRINKEMDNFLLELSPREAQVLRLRYGLDDNRPRTLEEVGAVFHVDSEKIRQIENKAIHKLQHPARYKRFINDEAEENALIKKNPMSSIIKWNTKDETYEYLRLKRVRDLDIFLKMNKRRYDLFFGDQLAIKEEMTSILDKYKNILKK